jgi:hypothetical protein
MKSLSQYITESFNKKKYSFKIKLAGELVENCQEKLKTLLEKYGVENLDKSSTTPVQKLPLDFPKLTNQEVTIFDTTLNYPATSYELHEYICNGLQIHADNVVVRNPNEPTEAYQEEVEPRKGALLNDPNYKEAGKVKADEYYGAKYNNNLLKELAKDSKARRKEQGEKVPTEGPQSAPEFISPGSKSPVGSSKA